MDKIIITLITILVILIGIIIGVGVYKTQIKVGENKNIENNINISEKVTDECVEEWEEIQNKQNSINTDSSEEKLSPNCSFTFKKHYILCDHTSNEYTNITEELVNCTQKDIEEKYPEWKIEKFSRNEVILSKDFEGECGEHYVLRNVNGNIVVYRIVNGIEEEYEKTEIAVDYLTETDKISFENGLKVYGKQNLSQILEDFE